MMYQQHMNNMPHHRRGTCGGLFLLGDGGDVIFCILPAVPMAIGLILNSNDYKYPSIKRFLILFSISGENGKIGYFHFCMRLLYYQSGFKN